MSEYRVDWKGTFVPSVTPFDKDGTFLEDHFRKVLEHLIADGVSGIIVAGCTGEWFSMSDTERRRLFEIAVEQIDGRVKVIAGTCAISTHETVALTRAAKDIGCDGCMIMSPHFIAVNEDEVIYHYAEVGKVGLPIMLYTLPVRLSYNLDAPMIERLLEIDAVVAIKDSSLEMPQMIETANRHGHRIAMFPGREGYTAAMIERGAVGTTAMMQNVVGYHAVKWYDHLAAGRWTESREHGRIIDGAYAICLGKAVTLSKKIGHWAMIKACMNILGRHGGYMRRPFAPFEDADIPVVTKALADIGLTAESLSMGKAAE